MIPLPASTNTTCSAHAGFLFEELTTSRLSSGVIIKGNRDKEDVLNSLNNTNSLCNFDALFTSVILISDQSFHFPAIEWCFDDDDDVDVDLESNIHHGATLDRARQSPRDAISQTLGSSLTERDMQHFPLPRSPARKNLIDFRQYLEQTNSATTISTLSKINS